MTDIHWRLLILVVVLVTVGVRFAYDYFYPATHLKPITWKERRSHLFMASLNLLIGGVLFAQLLGFEIVPMHLAPTMDLTIRCFGVFLGIIAAIGMTWPRIARRDAWSVPMTSPDEIGSHKLVTSGPYRYLRHPYYTSCFLGIVAIQLTVTSNFLFIISPVVLLLFILAIRKEEAQLETVYGGDYTSYRARSWGLIPLIY